MFRGSQALIDQADHVLYFYPVKKPGSDDPVDMDDLDSVTYFLGTRDKTRFEPCKFYVKRAGEKRFILTGDPDDEKMNLMKDILADRGQLKQRDFMKLVKDELGFGIPLTRRLLKRGEDRGTWTVMKGDKNSSLYQLFSFSPLYRGVKTEKQDSGSIPVDQEKHEDQGTESVDRHEFSCFSGHQNITKKHESDDTTPNADQEGWEHGD